MKFLKEVLNDIKPNPKYHEDLLSKLSIIINKIQRRLRDTQVILGGSGAKVTWLKIVVAKFFVKFNTTNNKERSNKFSIILEK